VSAACLARDGHRVVGVDVDRTKVDEINAGTSPIAEPGLDEMVREQVAAGALSATDDFAQAVHDTDVALIAVGTPSDRDGSVSSGAVQRVTRGIGEALRDCSQDYVVVVRSTLMPGILEDQLAPLLSAASGRELGDGLHLCNNPEFLRESTAIRDYDDPPFVVVGTMNHWSAEPVLRLYGSIDAEQIVTDTRTAALLKYACNSFHAAKIAFANEIGAIAKSLGADGRSVMELLCRDTKLNVSPAYLRPGFAFGGSCLPKDVRALVRYGQQQAFHLNVLSAILPSNDSHIARALATVRESGHRNVGMIGLSFKADTDDLRESPLVTFAETLLGRGHQIKIYDPSIQLSRLRGRNLTYVDRHLPHLAALLVDDPAELYEHASLLVLGNGIADRLNWSLHYHGDTLDLRRDLVTGVPEPVAPAGVLGEVF